MPSTKYCSPIRPSSWLRQPCTWWVPDKHNRPPNVESSFHKSPKTIHCPCHSVPFARLTLQTATPRICRSCLKIQLLKDSWYPSHLTKYWTLRPFFSLFQNGFNLVYVVCLNDSVILRHRMFLLEFHHGRLWLSIPGSGFDTFHYHKQFFSPVG